MKKFSLIFVAAVLLFTCVLGFAACDKNDKKIADNTEHFTDITKTLKLTKSYKDKVLATDGIGEAYPLEENQKSTDGDTTTFKLKKGGSDVVRYLGVDTPESTAGVEKWGKAASNFTTARLQEATEVVLEGSINNSGELDRDSVGQRALCYVWYKTADHDFYMLNLELVENGYSNNQADATSPYYSYFSKAEEFARSIELRWFSKLDDPLFDTAVVQLSLKDFAEHPENYPEGTKVRLEAFLIDGKYTSTYTFTMAQYDAETGRLYTLPLYAGHNSDSASNMNVGDFYDITGTLQTHNGSWQISGVKYNEKFKDRDEYTWTIQHSYYMIFNSSSELFTGQRTNNACSNLTVTEVNLEGNTLTFSGTASTYFDTQVTATFTVTVPSNYNNSIAVGDKLAISGAIQFTEGSNQFTILSYSDITKK